MTKRINWYKPKWTKKELTTKMILFISPRNGEVFAVKPYNAALVDSIAKQANLYPGFVKKHLEAGYTVAARKAEYRIGLWPR